MKTIGTLVIMGTLLIATVGCSGGASVNASATPNATTASPAAQ